MMTRHSSIWLAVGALTGTQNGCALMTARSLRKPIFIALSAFTLIIGVTALFMLSDRELEPLLGKLNKSGELSYLGWLGKLETHVLKIALVLHVFDCLGNSCQVPQIIPSRLIEASIDLVLEIGKHMRKIIQQAEKRVIPQRLMPSLNLCAQSA